MKEGTKIDPSLKHFRSTTISPPQSEMFATSLSIHLVFHSRVILKPLGPSQRSLLSSFKMTLLWKVKFIWLSLTILPFLHGYHGNKILIIFSPTNCIYHPIMIQFTQRTEKHKGEERSGNQSNHTKHKRIKPYQKKKCTKFHTL